MNLYTGKTIQKRENLLILGTEKSDFSSLLTSRDDRTFLKSRIKTEKNITVLHQTERNLVFIIIKTAKGSEVQLKEDARKAAFAVYPVLKDYDIDKAVLINRDISPQQMLAFVEGLYLTNYQFTKYFTKKEKKSFQIESLGLPAEGINSTELSRLIDLLEGVRFSRDLVNEPLSYLTAERLSEEIVKKGKEAGFSVEVFNKKKIESLRMGGLLAVNRGSIDPPTFSILEWKPENAFNKKPYVLVGKGVVYDTGGLSLKPTNDSMDYMKCDMSGAAAVAGAFYALAKSKFPVWVIGLIPATDNRPDGNAYVPGDVIEMYNGTTVEVLNTDAEGRMILADALSYASQYDPELVIELSTLTGSAHAAIGKYGIVGMGNAPEKVMRLLKKSGENTHERIAEFPFWSEYNELLKSDIADLKNVGGRDAGAITAGKFLETFTDYPFIHLDIAGPAFNKTEDSYRGKGGSGVGVRLLCDFFDQVTR